MSEDSTISVSFSSGTRACRQKVSSTLVTSNVDRLKKADPLAAPAGHARDNTHIDEHTHTNLVHTGLEWGAFHVCASSHVCAFMCCVNMHLFASVCAQVFILNTFQTKRRINRQQSLTKIQELGILHHISKPFHRMLQHASPKISQPG